MPCSDGGPSREDIRRVEGIKASWCAILTVLESQGGLQSVLNHCDWEEAGVTKEEVLGWWAEHKRRDRERRAYERKERERQALKKQALAKLTPEERDALKKYNW